VAGFKAEFVFISKQGNFLTLSFIAHSGDHFKP